ncbi:cyclic nucleotide-binding/CBS domain-containing protein [Legionella sp. W05-934-2]|jgi:CBS domain-containing protein|uniref:CBS domain-containing protein n=1 Tax=Legionella sp. W05-934-2 TaxID=1198649 RepID=UPI003461D57F
MADILAALLPKPRREMIFILPDVNVQQCCDLMVSNDIGALVVWDESNIQGIVSERDLVRKCLFRRCDAEKIKASDVMCSSISILPIEATVEKAISTITSTKRRHILVEEEGKVVAILSQGDILFHMLQTMQQTVDQLERYISNG